jgi:DNA-binding NarL/FixJ family response regulator
MRYDIDKSFTSFVIDTAKMAREAICAAFRETEPSLPFLPASSVADIASTGGDVLPFMVVVYAGSRSCKSEWMRRELLLASRAEMMTAVISDSMSGAEVIECLRLGARGYIPADFSFPAAISALKIIAAGELFIPAQVVGDGSLPRGVPSISGLQVPAAKSGPALGNGGWGALSWRERTVLELVCMGMPNKAIGDELGIAGSTVKIHVSKIMKKLQVSNRTQLCALLNGSKAACSR